MYNIIFYYNMISWDHRLICDPLLTETSFRGAWLLRTTSFGAKRELPRCSGCLRQPKLPSLSDVSCFTGLLLTHSRNLHCVHSSVVQLKRHMCSLLPAVHADAQRVPIINTYTHCPTHSTKDTELSSHDQLKSEDIGASVADQSLKACN
jgi:hypothetical protein